MTQQELVNMAVKRCYDEYEESRSDPRNWANLTLKFKTAKEYTKSWFDFQWKDVSMAQLDIAVQKMES